MLRAALDQSSEAQRSAAIARVRRIPARRRLASGVRPSRISCGTAGRAGALLIAPDDLLGEVGNGLRKRVAQGVLDREEAIEALGAVRALNIEFVAGADRWTAPSPQPGAWQRSAEFTVWSSLFRV